MKKLIIFTHGSSKGNPGPAAIGFSVLDTKGKVVKEMTETIGNASLEYASYYAVVRGLQVTKETFEQKTNDMQFELKLDCDTVKRQLCGEQEIKDISLIGHFIEINNLKVTNFSNLRWTLIKSDTNKKLAKLVDTTLDA